MDSSLLQITMFICFLLIELILIAAQSVRATLRSTFPQESLHISFSQSINSSHPRTKVETILNIPIPSSFSLPRLFHPYLTLITLSMHL